MQAVLEVKTDGFTELFITISKEDGWVGRCPAHPKTADMVIEICEVPMKAALGNASQVFKNGKYHVARLVYFGWYMYL